jgi:hypothetical protein
MCETEEAISKPVRFVDASPEEARARAFEKVYRLPSSRAPSRFLHISVRDDHQHHRRSRRPAAANGRRIRSRVCVSLPRLTAEESTSGSKFAQKRQRRC